MAKPGRATQAKRQRELAKQDKRREKEELRAIRKENKPAGDENLSPGQDPDLIGIFPGPHNAPNIE